MWERSLKTRGRAALFRVGRERPVPLPRLPWGCGARAAALLSVPGSFPSSSSAPPAPSRVAETRTVRCGALRFCFNLALDVVQVG